MGIVIVFISQALQTSLPADQMHHSRCQTRDAHTNSSLPCSPSFYTNSTTHNNTITPEDFGHAILFYLFLIAGVFILLVVAFHPRYRRISAEKKENFEASVYIQS